MAAGRFHGETSHGVNWTTSVAGKPLCENGTPWILYLLEECVDNIWEYLSVVIGLVSMFCFLLSTLPQVYVAYRNGKVEEAMSFGFLLFLFSGDLTNFAGCYLTNQLPIQVVAVIFYIFTDLILISQFIYYKIKNSSSKKNPLLKWLCFMWCGVGTLLLLSLPKIIINSTTTTQGPGINRKSMKLAGFVCGYIATIFYLLSRFPQLYKNFQRQSTEGTSYLLFILAMMGNGTYGLSVMLVLPALRGSKQAFIINHLAWLIGSMGVLILDFFVTAQFILYRNNRTPKSVALPSTTEVEPLLCEDEEQSVL
ncbi:LOW QUALITY PROTEIN: lysosomal amino acid transporter 1 homolog [Boleophthalmus pectinirostris]|uniref:LOW QUALITY PROTEIN: lysosomal amino acid transporter 1 homolog n=1 Tax=Boleophthalmus pectinirostris TaxID=150288 RepID=UPI00242E6889|nr:LOW QUALITY PROTEIN: lysosomal amino acid transporter 1 homolog [Boleophthalmus pectinirostris]